ncbi:hypothetical protein, partial [Novosphingobium sp.]|uniref:hypothetical protein n=1 Tax=Novosphingobium sp. TaxID=1874826 RepID=UPI0025D3FD5C
VAPNSTGGRTSAVPRGTSRVDGTINVAVDLRVKEENENIRMWISHRTESHLRRATFDLMIKIADQESQTGGVRSVLADMAFENGDGISKGLLGRGIFQSLMFGTAPYISPPFWWPTGCSRVDRSVMTAHSAKYGLDSDLTMSDDLFRYAVGADFVSTIQGLGWNIDQSGIGIETLNDRIEVVDAFYGPFN